MQIIPHPIKGIPEVYFHDFTFSQDEATREIIISAGTYYQNGAPVFSNPNEMRFPLPEIREWIQHEFWITTNGIMLYSSPEFMIIPENPIDRLGWIMIFAPLPAEEDVELHVTVYEA